MNKSMEEITRVQSMSCLKLSLEEAEIIKTGLKIVLMNPSLNSEYKSEYVRVYAKLNDDIRELKLQRAQASLPKN